MNQLLPYLLVILPLGLMAQTVVIEEDFETGTGIFTGAGIDPWEQNDSLAAKGNFSIHSAYQNGANNTLTLTSAVDLSPYTGLLLQFKHIGKVEISDVVIVEISTDAGNTWTTLDQNYYQGSAFLLNGSQFFDGSYTDWQFNNYVNPTNSWWRSETYNISSFNSSTVKIRFSLDADGSLNYYGWLIDDFKIIGVLNTEVDPPLISHTPVVTTGTTDPLKIMATITDATGVDSAQLFFRVNDGPWMGPKSMFDKGNGEYEYSIPGQPVGTKVDYYMRAVDATVLQNVAIHPSGQGASFHSYQVIEAISAYPYLEDFETATANQWIHTDDLTIGNTGVVPIDDWQLGIPATFFLNRAYSGSKAYATQLTTGYSGNSRSSLLSPVFDLSNLTEGTLSFFHKFLTDFGDGCRIDYIHGDFSTISNNQAWKVLGGLNDTKAAHWYNEAVIGSASNVQDKPGWTLYSADEPGANQEGWLFSTYEITNLVGPGKYIRFRFVFTSLAFSFNNEGWMIDNVAVDNTVGIAEPVDFYTSETTVNAPYPNPATSMTYIPIMLHDKQDVRIQVYNALGELVYTRLLSGLTPGKHLEPVPLLGFSNGIYSIQVEIDDKVFNSKLAKVQ